MWPAIIATNSRRPRLNGRTMKEMNSIGAISGIIGSGVPCGTNSEKKCKPWRQKPTISTIEKLSIASTPVMLKWLVVVKLCTPGMIPNGIRPSKVGDQDEGEQRKQVGHELLALGADVHASQAVDEAGQPFDRHLPAARHQLALHAQHHETEDRARARPASTAELLVKLMSYGPMCSGTIGSTLNWCIGSILPSAATSLATSSLSCPEVSGLVNRMMFLTPTPNPKNSISRKNIGKVR